MLSAPLGAQAVPAPPAERPSGPMLLTIGNALRSALSRNPDLLNSSDFLLSAEWNERAVRSTFLPQAVPFVSTEKSDETGERTDTYGLFVTEQFPFGTSLEGQAIVNRQPQAPGGESHTADYRLTLRQPFLRGADPAVSAEPLRLARRSTHARSRALEVARRRTVLLIYQTYLGVSRQEEALKLAADRVQRARELTEFSRARFSAGSVSRLDVLRAEQQEASTVVTLNDARARSTTCATRCVGPPDSPRTSSSRSRCRSGSPSRSPTSRKRSKGAWTCVPKRSREGTRSPTRSFR